MKDRTIKFKVGKPVKVVQYLGFLHSIEAQEQNAQMFAADDRRRQEVGAALLKSILGVAD